MTVSAQSTFTSESVEPPWGNLCATVLARESVLGSCRRLATTVQVANPLDDCHLLTPGFTRFAQIASYIYSARYCLDGDTTVLFNTLQAGQRLATSLAHHRANLQHEGSSVSYFHSSYNRSLVSTMLAQGKLEYLGYSGRKC